MVQNTIINEKVHPQKESEKSLVKIIVQVSLILLILFSIVAGINFYQDFTDDNSYLSEKVEILDIDHGFGLWGPDAYILTNSSKRFAKSMTIRENDFSIVPKLRKGDIISWKIRYKEEISFDGGTWTEYRVLKVKLIE